ncbi:MAG: heme-copper oxidase subunit III [Alphaproteobacteria bacterium]|nr:heme-copper oxidase subunit III [Alphaproteobacteria bacterium]
MAEQASPGGLHPLPVGNISPHSMGLLGFWGLVATEAALFGALLFAYFYSAFGAGRAWPPEGLPTLALSGPNTAILAASSITLWLGERAMKRRGSRRGLALGTAASLALGILFLAIQIKEWADKGYGIDDHAYAAHFYTITGFHVAHVVFGLILLAAMLIWTLRNYFSKARHEPVVMVSLYWHFVDVVWLFVFASLYLSPYLLR